MATRKLLICTSALLLLCFTFLLSGCGGTSHPSEETPPPSQATAAPTIASISPASVTAGSVPLALHVTGTGFVSGSVISFNGTSLQTTYVSSTQLSASVPASLLATSGSFSVAVVNPDGQKSGGSSGGSGSTFSVDNGQPTITALTPGSIPAGSAATDVVVAGTNFISSSIASFGGSPRPTKIQGATQLTVSLTASDLTTARTVDIVVTNPAPGGGTSAPSPLTITTPLPPAPVLTSLSPSSAVVGSPDTTVILTGRDFTPHSQVVGFELTSAYVSPTTMTATIPAYYLSTTNTFQISVFDSGRQSNSLSFAVVNPVPVLSSISPSTVTAGAPDFNLVLQASGIVYGSQIMVNGTPRETFTGNGGIAIRISASEVAEPGSLDISIVNPAPGGGTSATLKLSVIAGENRIRTVPLQANALTWDPKQQRIYAAVSASAKSNASSVVAIDPATGAIVASQQMSAEPTLLSITDDQQFLYVGMKASAAIARLKLPSLAPDIQWNAGVPWPGTSSGLTDLQAAPGLPHTVAAAQQQDSAGTKVLAIYDDGVMRPLAASAPACCQVTVDRIQWGADASIVYGSTTVVSGGNELTFSIDASGSTFKSSRPGILAEFSPFFYDRPTGQIDDPAGDVIDPATGRLLAKYAGVQLYGGFAIDSTLHRAYYMSGNFNVQYPQDALGTQIDIFDQNQHNFLNALYLDTDFFTTGNGNGSLIRWGAAGLAFTGGSTICIIDGPFVAPGTAPTSKTGGYANPAPVLSSLSPESVPAGSPDTVITLSGQSFTPSTLITWSGNIVASTLVNSTTMQVTLPAASLTTPGAGLMVAANDPNDAQSNPLGFTVTPNLGTGMQLRAINVSGSDLVWNGAAGLLYASVPATDLLHGNTIASIDPVAGVLRSVVPTASDPFTLAISQDNQLLYAGFAGTTSIQRYALPAMTPDITIPLGVGDTAGYAAGSALSCGYAVSMKVAPGSPQTIAVTQGNREIDVIGCGPVAIFDGAMPRSQTLFGFATSPADFSNLVWGKNDSTLYAQSSNEIDVQYISILDVAPSGVTLNQTFSNDNYLGWRPHFDAGTGLIYSDGGAVTDPGSGLMVGNFMASGLMVPDSKLGRAYFLGRDTEDTNTAANSNALPYTLQIYDLKTFTLLDSIKIPSVIGFPEQMVRWGTDGIAFTTGGGFDIDTFLPGMTYIVSGVRITGAGGTNPSISQQADHVQMTWQPGARPHKQNLQSSAF